MFTAVTVSSTIFLNAMPCSLVDANQAARRHILKDSVLRCVYKCFFSYAQNNMFTLYLFSINALFIYFKKI